MVGGFCTIIDAYCTALMPNHCDSELYDHGVEHTMYKFCVITLLAFALVGCGLTPEAKQRRAANIQACRDSGGTAYVSFNTLDKCAMPNEQARLERLELACINSGGTPKYANFGGYYENCRRPAASTASNSGSGSSGFKPYCPPSKTPIYGCPPPTQVIIVD